MRSETKAVRYVKEVSTISWLCCVYMGVHSLRAFSAGLTRIEANEGQKETRGQRRVTKCRTSPLHGAQLLSWVGSARRSPAGNVNAAMRLRFTRVTAKALLQTLIYVVLFCGLTMPATVHIIVD